MSEAEIADDAVCPNRPGVAGDEDFWEAGDEDFWEAEDVDAVAAGFFDQGDDIADAALEVEPGGLGLHGADFEFLVAHAA